jgi:hypothetical protein
MHASEVVSHATTTKNAQTEPYLQIRGNTDRYRIMLCQRGAYMYARRVKIIFPLITTILGR